MIEEIYRIKKKTLVNLKLEIHNATFWFRNYKMIQKRIRVRNE